MSTFLCMCMLMLTSMLVSIEAQLFVSPSPSPSSSFDYAVCRQISRLTTPLACSECFAVTSSDCHYCGSSGTCLAGDTRGPYPNAGGYCFQGWMLDASNCTQLDSKQYWPGVALLANNFNTIFWIMFGCMLLVGTLILMLYGVIPHIFEFDYTWKPIVTRM